MAETNEDDPRIPHKTITEKIKYSLNNPLFSDVKIIVDYLDDKGNHAAKTFWAHSFFLKWASPVFENMLDSDMREKSHTININDISPEAYLAFLTFVYTEHVEIDSSLLAWDLYGVGHKYLIEPLQNFCLKYIKKHLSPTTVWNALAMSLLYELEEIKSLSRKILVNQTVKTLNVPDFMVVNEDLIAFLLDEPKLAVREGMLYQRIENWIKSEVLRRGENDIKRENEQKALIKRFIPKIHFLDMTSEEFLEGPYKSDLLSVEQKLSIIANISSKRPLELVEGLSSFKKRRNWGADLSGYPGAVNTLEFETDSYVLLKQSITSPSNTYISFMVKTSSTNGLILSVVDTNDRYLLVGVLDGMLNFNIKGSKDSNCTMISKQRVDDSTSHQVILKRLKDLRFKDPFDDSVCYQLTVDDVKGVSSSHSMDASYAPTSGVVYLGGRPGYSFPNFKNSINGCIGFLKTTETGEFVDFKTNLLNNINTTVCVCDFGG